jgi:uncharacterized protein with ParB-like and HNH nuclease domain
MTGVRPSAQAKNIYELFAGKVFKVPDYQRSYSWTEKNWEDFWNDIKEGLLTDTEHYWGTITLKATGKTLYCEEKEIPFNLYEVVDGQQRITTIYLFLLALANVSNKSALRDSFIKCGNDIYRLELGGLNGQFLKDLVDGKNPQPHIKTNKLLKQCLEYFENQIRAFNRLNDLSRYLQDKTFSLEFIVQDQTLAVKAFESLNDRGRPLTLLDKTKSYLMFMSLRYLGGKFNRFINDVFGNVFINYDIIKELGEQENISYIKSNRFTEDELLRFFYHYFARSAIQKYNLPVGYDFDATANDVFEIFLKATCNHLKNNQKSLEDFIRDFLDSINKFVFSFKDIISQVEKDCKFKKLFSFLGLNTRIYPLIISLKVENLLNDRMLELIETLDIRVYKVRGTDPRARLYREVISQIKINPNYTHIENGIKSFINEFMPDPLFQYYLNQNIYDNSATKFILWEYEKYKDPSFDNCNTSIYADCQKEHIFAQNPKPTFPSYGFNTEEEYFANIHRLGNLCLLEEMFNKQCKNKLPNQKVQYYQQSAIPRTKQLGYQVSNREFSKNDIDNITKDIIRFCLNRWKL